MGGGPAISRRHERHHKPSSPHRALACGSLQAVSLHRLLSGAAILSRPADNETAGSTFHARGVHASRHQGSDFLTGSAYLRCRAQQREATPHKQRNKPHVGGRHTVPISASIPQISQYLMIAIPLSKKHGFR